MDIFYHAVSSYCVLGENEEVQHAGDYSEMLARWAAVRNKFEGLLAEMVLSKIKLLKDEK